MPAFLGGVSAVEWWTASPRLEHLHEETGLSKTDIMNRAISLYAFVSEQLDSGQDLLLRDRQSGEMQRIQLF
jgi:hypothetical protein